MTADLRRAAAPRKAVSVAAPSLRHERVVLRSGHRVLAGMDEVGRGALAGPVTVGVVLVDLTTRSAPAGVRDSKLLSPARREALVGPIRRWAPAWGVGHAQPDEIDAIGIIAALRLAAHRALDEAAERAGEALPRPDAVLLDGNHDWFTDPAEQGLLGLLTPAPAVDGPRVHTRIKADMACSSVAAASVLAKVERDALMVEHARNHPEYSWEINKGYAAPAHTAALRRLGPCALHRRSWNLGCPPGRHGDGP